MINNNKGIAIFVSLALLFLLSLAAIAVLLTAYNYNSICEGQIKRMKAMASAEAGIVYGYKYLYDYPKANPINPIYGGGTLSFTLNGVPVTITISAPVSGRYTISSKASY